MLRHRCRHADRSDPEEDYDSLFTFGSAAIVGFVMELLAVAVTDIYYYNPDFYLNLGSVPKQFPVFGGFMWGGLTVYGIKLAPKLKWKPFPTALAVGMFIVTMDILLDVVNIYDVIGVLSVHDGSHHRGCGDARIPPDR